MRIGGRSPPFPDAELIRTLAALLNETGLTEIEYAIGDRRIRIARVPGGPGVAPTPQVAALSPLPAPAAPSALSWVTHRRPRAVRQGTRIRNREGK